MKISVIMPAHQAGFIFERSVASILNSNFKNFELIVVADGNYNIPEIPHVITVFLPNSMGPAHARNIGANKASGDILYFTDSDVEIMPETLTLVHDFFIDNDNIAMIGSYDSAPYYRSYISMFKNLSHHFIHQNSKNIINTFWGACGAIRKKTFDEMNGFDAITYKRPCVEDIELGYRLSTAGYEIHLKKEIQVKHLKKWTLISFIKTDLFDRAIPWTHLLRKYKNLPHNNLNLDIKNKVNAFLVIIVILTFFIDYKLSIVCLATFICLNINLLVFLGKKNFILSLFSIPLLILHYLVALTGFMLVKLKIK